MTDRLLQWGIVTIVFVSGIIFIGMLYLFFKRLGMLEPEKKEAKNNV